MTSLTCWIQGQQLLSKLSFHPFLIPHKPTILSTAISSQHVFPSCPAAQCWDSSVEAPGDRLLSSVLPSCTNWLLRLWTTNFLNLSLCLIASFVKWRQVRLTSQSYEDEMSLQLLSSFYPSLSFSTVLGIVNTQ